MTSYPPIEDADWPDEILDMLNGFAGRLNVYRTMAHHPALLRAWASLRQHVVVDNALGVQFSEIVILRTAFRVGSRYEWRHHVVRATKYGVATGRVTSLQGDVSSMELEDAVLAKAVDELVDQRSLNAQTRESLEGLVGIRGLFDVIATVGFYMTLSFILLTCSTPLENELE